MANIEEIVAAGRWLIAHARSKGLDRENKLDKPFHNYLQRTFDVPVDRQEYIESLAWDRPKRFDFRFGGVNPVALELAVRAMDNKGTIYGPSNYDELTKLMRLPQSQYRLRCLLLVDLCATPFERDALRATYSRLNGGRGNIPYRNSVRIVYVQASTSYSFLWWP